MDRIISNKFYIFSSLCMFVYLLNFCTAIYECALVFTIIAIMANFIEFTYGKSAGMKWLAFAVALSYFLVGTLPYYIDGKIVNGLVFASFTSLIISIYWSMFVFQKLTSKYSLVTANAISLIIAAIVDGCIMGLFFVCNNNLPYLRILSIFSKELSYRILYGFVASAIIFACLKMFKTRDNLNLN